MNRAMNQTVNRAANRTANHAANHAVNRTANRSPRTGSRAAPASAALLLALSPQAAVGEAIPQSVEAAALLPGVEHARVLVPDGELAGHAVSVSAVDSRRVPEDVLAEVEGHWRRQGADPVLRAQSGAWSVLSRRIDSGSSQAGGGADGTRSDDGFETLQLRASPGGGSEGLFTRWLRSGATRVDMPTPLEHLLPAEARAVRQLSSRDAGIHSAETLIARFAHTLEESEIRIERHLRRAGFVPMPAPQHPSALSWRDDRARFFRGPTSQLLVTLHRQDRGTSVVLYHVRGVP